MTDSSTDSSKPSKATVGASVALVGAFGACITLIRDLALSQGLISGDFVGITKLAIPALSMGVYVAVMWGWDSIKPQSAKQIRDRRHHKNAIAECDKQLESDRLTEQGRDDLLRKREQLGLGVIETLTDD